MVDAAESSVDVIYSIDKSQWLRSERRKSNTKSIHTYGGYMRNVVSSTVSFFACQAFIHLSVHSFIRPIHLFVFGSNGPPEDCFVSAAQPWRSCRNSVGAHHIQQIEPHFIKTLRPATRLFTKASQGAFASFWIYQTPWLLLFLIPYLSPHYSTSSACSVPHPRTNPRGCVFS